MESKCEFCRMRILVTAATKFEIDPFMADHKDVETLITGVGVPATLYHLQKKIHQNKYDLIVQAGIAGGFTNDLELGKCVLVKQDTFADIGMEENENFTTIFQSGFTDKDAYPFIDGWLINPNNIFSRSLLPEAKAITVNKVSDSLLQRQQFIKAFSPGIETMEGAAFHYVCLQENIPFIQIRSISNFVGIRNKSQWKIRDAITNLNNELNHLVELFQAATKPAATNV